MQHGRDRRVRWFQAGTAAPELRRADRRHTALAALLAAVLMAAVLPTAAPGQSEPSAQLIVRALPGQVAAVERAVKQLGGHVRQRLGIIDGFSATVAEDQLGRLREEPGVHSITSDSSVRMHSSLGFDASVPFGSLYNITKAVGAQDAWSNKVTGNGVGVALIDTGVTQVEGLTGRIINGADLSFDPATGLAPYADNYGHGTHMAGVIAGRDGNVGAGNENDSKNFVGVAPDAKIVNVKVGSANGAVDVSQVLAAIDWVVEHRKDPGMNIRVLNLSFGTDGVQDYRVDPLAYAAEVAWRKGIVVVAAAGNDGFGSAKLNNPAYDPFVIAVGAAELNNTYGVDDDKVAAYSQRGDASRSVDLLAPGSAVISSRAAGSLADTSYSSARVGQRFFRGSGTSQAAAVVSGAAALLIQQRPTITPDQVKRLLLTTAQRLPNEPQTAQGAGLLDVKRAHEAATPNYRQTWVPSTGTGSLESARGSIHIADASGDLTGERDIFGLPWNGAGWASASLSETSWTGGTWRGEAWTGTCWCQTSWAGAGWQRSSWRETNWSRSSWRATGWSRSSWRGAVWSTAGWQ